jgi:hypothetical protein
VASIRRQLNEERQQAITSVQNATRNSRTSNSVSDYNRLHCCITPLCVAELVYKRHSIGSQASRRSCINYNVSIENDMTNTPPCLEHQRMNKPLQRLFIAAAVLGERACSYSPKSCSILYNIIWFAICVKPKYLIPTTLQEINIAEQLRFLRQQRMNLVQNIEQYRFVYECLVDYLCSSRLI